MKFVLVYNQKKKNAKEFAEMACEQLRSSYELKVFSLKDQLDESVCEADLIITAGGDGTTLKTIFFAANSCGYNVPPILSVNFGRKGYLSSCRPEDFFKCLRKFNSGSFNIKKRRLAACTVNNSSVYFLNEASFLRYPESQLQEFHLKAAGLDLNVRADGLIVATETGSTAYCASAGGAQIVGADKDLSVVFLAPEEKINPVVIGKEAQPVLISCRKEGIALAFDGYVFGLKSPFECHIFMSEKFVNFLVADD